MSKQRLMGLILLSYLASSSGFATDLTVYNQDLGLVRDVRKLSFKKGVNTVSLTDVAAQIDPTSVHFKALSRPNAVSVIEQNFQYDLINQQKLLQKYVGKEIEFERYSGLSGEKRETIKGILLSVNDGPVIQVGKKLHLNPDGRPVLPELPDGLLTKPTLVWTLTSDREGKEECEISYLTTGISWNADYVAVVNAADDKLDLNSWVTVRNNSGATYPDVRLKLVAGDVNRLAPAVDRRLVKARFAELASNEAPPFREKSFFEYHLYTLQRPTTVRDNETKQIEMASSADVPLKKLYVYEPVTRGFWGEYNEYTRSDSNYSPSVEKKVMVALEIKNSVENNLGTPLPKGRVRVYKKDVDGALEFIGEDEIDHTAKDEKIQINMGNAFDVVGERKKTNFSVDNAKRWSQESFEIKIRNHKEQPVTVTVVEPLYRWSDWKITEASQKWRKRDARTIEFQVPVAKDGESVVTYTVKYAW